MPLFLLFKLELKLFALFNYGSNREFTMTTKQRLTKLFLILCLVLCGCGGGGVSSTSVSGGSGGSGGSGSSGDSGGGTPTPNYSSLASVAALTSSLNLATNTELLGWTDNFPAGTLYTIQTVANGVGTTVATQASTGSNNPFTWKQVISTSTSYQVLATVNGQIFPLLTTSGASTVTATLPSSTPAISITTTTGGAISGVLGGTVQLSLNNNFAYPSVTWFYDTTSLGTGTGVGDPFNWNTTATTNGSHVVFAVINLSASESITVRQTVTVANSNLAVNASNSGTSGTILVNVSATSSYAVTSVSATLDGTALATLSSPNACSPSCTSPNNIYQFTLSTTSGTHTFVATATDSAGSSKSATLTLSVSNPPSLVVTSPLDGSFINGSNPLSISGTSTSDRTGAVTVAAYLGSLPIPLSQPTTTNSAYTGSFSLAGLPAGAYTLTVSSTDSTGVVTTAQSSVVVASSSATTYAPAFSMGAGGQLIAVDNSLPNTILYKAPDSTYRVRNVATGSEVTLQGANNIPFTYNWAMDGGYVFMEGGWLGSTSAGYTDCPVDCIYQWTASGVKSNISNANPNKGSYEQYPRAHAGYVIWIDWNGPNPGTYTVYNVTSGTYAKVSMPAGANYPGNTQYDFSVSGGVVNFAYWANTGGSGTSSIFDVYQWNSSTNTSTKLSNGTARNIYPQIDGQRVAWTQSPVSGAPSTLFSEPVSLGSVTTVSSSETNFNLAGGVLAWTEGTTTTNSQGISTTTYTGLKASNTGGSVTTISTSANIGLMGNGGGYVAYSLQGKVYDWSSSTGTSSLIIDTVPGQTLVSGSTMYFTMGTSNQVYSLTLH